MAELVDHVSRLEGASVTRLIRCPYGNIAIQQDYDLTQGFVIMPVFSVDLMTAQQHAD